MFLPAVMSTGKDCLEDAADNYQKAVGGLGFVGCRCPQVVLSIDCLLGSTPTYSGFVVIAKYNASQALLDAVEEQADSKEPVKGRYLPRGHACCRLLQAPLGAHSH